MKKIANLFGMIAAMSLAIAPAPAFAKDYEFTPATEEGVDIRYLQGVPTVTMADENGGIMVTQTEEIYGRVRMNVAFTNASDVPVNFGIENITATIDGEPVEIMSADGLEKIAKRKAGWANFAVAMAGGLGAAAANMNANRTYTTVGHTRYGSYYSQTTVRDPAAAAVGTAASVGGAAYAMTRINANLEQTLGAIQNNVIQTTTVDPKGNYGGMLVFDKFKVDKKAPGRLELIIRRNANDADGYRVAFDLKRSK